MSKGGKNRPCSMRAYQRNTNNPFYNFCWTLLHTSPSHIMWLIFN